MPVGNVTSVRLVTGPDGNINEVTAALPLPVTAVAGTSALGDVGIQYRASNTGAASLAHLVAAATTNATVVKASAGRLLGWHLANTTAAWLYVKVHNSATAPTAGTGVIQTIGIAPGSVAASNFPGGIGFAAGIGITTVTGATDADAVAVAAGAIVGDIFFA